MKTTTYLIIIVVCAFMIGYMLGSYYTGTIHDGDLELGKELGKSEYEHVLSEHGYWYDDSDGVIWVKTSDNRVFKIDNNQTNITLITDW